MSDLKIVPLADRVVVKPITETQSKSGIVIPKSAESEKSDQGEVVAVGAGKMEDGKLVPMTIKVGDKVIFAKYSPSEVEVDGQKYLVVKEEDILATIQQ